MSGANDIMAANDAEPPSIESLVLHFGGNLGAGLRAAREYAGQSLQDIADATKVRTAYLAALEDFDLAGLPSRPFLVGYVRAYARHLGISEDAALARFNRDAPNEDSGLRAPVGVAAERDPRIGLVAAGFAIIVAAIVIWNVAQRTMAEREPDLPPPVATALPDQPTGPVALGEALPAPPEATIPTPYVTPGLAPVDPNAPPAAAPAPPVEPRPFAPRGKIYGVAPELSKIAFEATRSVSVVIRGADGKVYFAQQLQANEAYRAPVIPGLMVDVSAPDAVQVYVDGMLKGALTQPVTPLSALVKP